MAAWVIPLISAAASIIGGLISQSKHKKYAEMIGETELEMPSGMMKAHEILESAATGGFPGLPTMKGDIEASGAATISRIKEKGVGAALSGAIADVGGGVAEQKRKLAIADAQQKVMNKINFARFLSQIEAPMEMGIQDYRTRMMLGAEQERMLGTKELLAGVTRGIGAGIGTYGKMQYLDYLKGGGKPGGEGLGDIPLEGIMPRQTDIGGLPPERLEEREMPEISDLIYSQLFDQEDYGKYSSDVAPKDMSNLFYQFNTNY